MLLSIPKVQTSFPEVRMLVEVLHAKTCQLLLLILYCLWLWPFLLKTFLNVCLVLGRQPCSDGDVHAVGIGSRDANHIYKKCCLVCPGGHTDTCEARGRKERIRLRRRAPDLELNGDTDPDMPELVPCIPQPGPEKA